MFGTVMAHVVAFRIVVERLTATEEVSIRCAFQLVDLTTSTNPEMQGTQDIPCLLFTHQIQQSGTHIRGSDGDKERGLY